MAEQEAATTKELAINIATEAIGLVFTVRILTSGKLLKGKLPKIRYIAAALNGVKSTVVIYENLCELSRREEVQGYISDVKLSIVRMLWRLEKRLPIDHFPFIPRPIPLADAAAQMVDLFHFDLSSEQRTAMIADTAELMKAKIDELDRNRK